MKSKLIMTVALALPLTVNTSAFADPEAEVLHWWTSGGEAKSVAVLQNEFASRGGAWTDMPVAGGGGDAAMTALRARVLSGNAPTAVQLKGPSIRNGMKKVLLQIFQLLQKQIIGQVYFQRRSLVICNVRASGALRL